MRDIAWRVGIGAIAAIDIPSTGLRLFSLAMGYGSYLTEVVV